jgi:hypothetical protein
MATQPIKLTRQMIATAHNIMACIRLGFSMRVNTATTASFGTPNDRTPGKKATMVHMMAWENWFSVKRAAWRPLPYETAFADTATVTQPQT